MLESLSQHQLLVFWVQICALVLAARLLGALMRRIGQPAVIGELGAGLLLGPSVFGRLWPAGFEWFLPHDTLETGALLAVGWIGVALLLVVTGFETDLGLIRRFRRAATLVAAGSLLLPFALGIGVGFGMPGRFLGGEQSRLVFALFMATALSISSLPVIAKILSELNLLRRNFGQITLAAGMANDVVGWLLLGVIAGLAQKGTVSVGGLVKSLGGMILFVVLAMTVGQRAIDAALRRTRRDKGGGVASGLSVSLLFALGFAVATQALGVEAVLGAFVAGILLGRSRFQHEQVFHQIESITLSLFAPLFFATAGLRVDLGQLAEPEVLVWGLVVLAVACLAKFAGAFVGARCAGLSSREGIALGAGLNARGALEIVIATVGVGLGVLNGAAYTIVVLMAMATSIMAPPTLRLAVRGWHGSDEEQERLGREEALSKNLLVRTERLLLPSRGSPNSIAAAQVLHFAWPESTPATILSVEVDGTAADVAPIVNVLDQRDHDVRVIPSQDVVGEVLEEAKLGYGVIVVGATGLDAGSPNIDGASLLSPMVDEILRKCNLPTVIVRRARNLGTRLPGAFGRALVPVTGSQGSRAAEEVALNLSQRLGTEVVLTHVVNRPTQPTATSGSTADVAASTAASPDDAGSGVVKQATRVAAALGVTTRSTVRTSVSVAEELVAAAEDEDADLIVVGCTLRRLDNRPFLGHTVEYVLEHSDATVVAVVLPLEQDQHQEEVAEAEDTAESRPDRAVEELL